MTVVKLPGSEFSDAFCDDINIIYLITYYKIGI